MDTNKYRAQYRYTQGEGCLTNEERDNLLKKYNKPGERICVQCDKKFFSEGAHNRRCRACKNRYEINQTHHYTREPVLHKDPTLKTRRFAEFTY